MKKQELTKDEVFAKRKNLEQKKEQRIPQLSAEQKDIYIKRFGEEKIAEFEKMANGRQLIYIKVEESLAVLRPPTAEDLGEYMMGIAEHGMAKAGVMIINQLWLDGDLDLIDDEEKYIAVFLQMSNLLEGKKGEFFRG